MKAAMRPVTALTGALVFAVVTAQASATDELIPGEVTVVKAGRLARFVSRSRLHFGDAPFTLPTLGSVDDPTVNGAALMFTDVGLVAGSVTYALDASGWRALGDPPGSRGYRYRGKDDTADPNPGGSCRTVLLKDTVIKASCTVGVTLSTPFADAESIVLGMGAGTTSARYCAEFGGEEKRSDALVMKRVDAPRPLACPVTDCPVIDVSLPVAKVAGACWYLAPDTSCSAICGLAGLQYSEATRTFAGSDGAEVNCTTVATALGGGAAVDGDCASVGLSGLGCVALTEGVPFPVVVRCVTPPTTAGASEIGALRVCACR